ncbi:MAG: hypothetical protein VYC17_01000 [Nitrospinota bacterium]|nr:hypothetical protein [Nitrospinota bacterium]
MGENLDTCSKCGKKSILKGDIGLRNNKTMDLVVVVRQDHGVEKNVPLRPKVCGKCGFVDLYVKDPTHLKICSEDKPINPDFKQRPLLEADF